MSTGTTKDRQLLEVLDEVITRNKAEYEIEDGNNEDFEGESEHAGDDDLEEENTNKNEVVDKSHSLDLESQQDSHTETDGYGDSNNETCRQQVPVHDVTSEKLIETNSVNVDHDVCTQKRDGVNDKESDSVVTSTVVDLHDGQGNTYNLIVIGPSQAKQEAKKDSINSDSVNTDSTNKHYVYDVKTGMAYAICDLDLSSFNQLFLIDPVQTPSGMQHRVTQVQLATGPAIATPDTPPPDTTTTTTEKPSLTNIPVVVTPEKPAAPTKDNVPSPHAGEVHVLKMIVEDIDFDDVKVKKEPCSDDDNIRERDRQLEQKDNKNIMEKTK